MKFFLVLSVCVHMAVVILWDKPLLSSLGTSHATTQISLFIKPAGHPAGVRSQTLPVSAPEAAHAAATKQKGSAETRPDHEKQTTQNDEPVSEKTTHERPDTNTAKSASINFLSTDSLNTAVTSPLQKTGKPTAKNLATGQKDMSLGNHAKISATLQQLISANFVYPSLARRRGWEGDVLLEIRLEANGSLSNVQVSRSSGYPVLDRSALRSVKEAGSTPEIIEWLAGNHMDMMLPIQYRLLDS